MVVLRPLGARQVLVFFRVRPTQNQGQVAQARPLGRRQQVDAPLKGPGGFCASVEPP
jgi:hypothetical protein